MSLAAINNYLNDGIRGVVFMRAYGEGCRNAAGGKTPNLVCFHL